MQLKAFILLLWFLAMPHSESLAEPNDAPQWQEVELEFTAENDTTNPYLEIVVGKANTQYRLQNERAASYRFCGQVIVSSFGFDSGFGLRRNVHLTLPR